LRTAATLLLLATALGAAPPPRDERVTLLAAMQDELSRSMERLELKGYQAPYFVGYQLKEVWHHEVSGRFGAVFDDGERRTRTLQVDVRVGSYAFDSSAPRESPFTVGQDGPTWYAPMQAPLDGDPAALRNALWLLTDEKYKEALASFLKKQSREVYRRDDLARSPSFTREAAERQVDPPLPFPFDRERWRRTVREATSVLRDHPDVFDAEVRVAADKTVRFTANSEGTGLVTEQVLYGVHLSAVARALDGQLLENGRDFYATAERDLPSRETLIAVAREAVSELEALRVAPAIDPYTGPAILEPEAAGVLFHEAVGHRLEGERIEDDEEGQTFKGQIGRPVLPPFLSIVDDPTLARAAGVALNGAYAFDDQGVRARRTVLVRDGTLESYLLSRRPVRPFDRSNGHGRAQALRQPMARMANLIVESSRRVPAEELKALLMAEARRQGKAYGLRLRDISGGNTNTMSHGYQAFKGTPRMVYRVDAVTGEEQLVRGVEMVGTPLASVNKVLATGETLRVFNGYCGAESGYVPVSTVSPAVLVAEIELQRVARQNERSPILPAPWTEKARPGR
jgi:predicted Zn-dependent protease